MQIRLNTGWRGFPARIMRRTATVCLSVMLVLLPDWAASDDVTTDAVAEPLRVINLGPFHASYGAPASFGVQTMPQGLTEVIAIARHGVLPE